MQRILYLFLFLSFQAAFGCTDFVVQTTDGTYVNGRSLEFAIDLEAKIRVFPREGKYMSKGPKGEKGVEWTARYGYLGITVFDLQFSMDGMNEKGLSVGFLWLPGTQYQTSAAADQRPLDFVHLADWILGNFATVTEVKEALSSVSVWGHPVPPLPGIPPIHAAVHDAQGRHLVIEFIGGKMKVYDNPTTVLTNYPPFDWMLTNLQNYIHLDAYNAPPINWNHLTLKGTGQGTGLLGMPGDATPPSRFVRTITYLRFAEPVSTPLEGVNLAEHLLNGVDIPLGLIREQVEHKIHEDYTQWIVIKNLTSKVFYFRSYKDLCLKSIDMKQLDFSPGKSHAPISIDLRKGYVDITPMMQPTSSSVRSLP